MSDPVEEVEMKAVRDLQQLQSLCGRAERKRDLETIICVHHQLCRAFVVLEQRLEWEIYWQLSQLYLLWLGGFLYLKMNSWAHLNFADKRWCHSFFKIVNGRVRVQNFDNLQILMLGWSLVRDLKMKKFKKKTHQNHILNNRWKYLNRAEFRAFFNDLLGIIISGFVDLQ